MHYMQSLFLIYSEVNAMPSLSIFGELKKKLI